MDPTPDALGPGCFSQSVSVLGTAQVPIDWTGTTRDGKSERYRDLVPLVLRDGVWRIERFGGMKRQ